jgi:hypothetical protein
VNIGETILIPREAKAVDTIGNDWVSIDVLYDTRKRVSDYGYETGSAGWQAGPSVPVNAWRDYERAKTKRERAQRKFLEADEKATRAYKASRYVYVNGLYDEAVDGAKIATWEKRLAKWAPLAENLRGPLDEAERAEAELLALVASWNDPDNEQNLLAAIRGWA